VRHLQEPTPSFKLLYQDALPLASKIRTIAQKIYGAKDVNYSDLAQQQLSQLEAEYEHMPICIAKTQYSFSSDAKLRNNPTGHTLQVKSLRLSRGAGFVVAICGDIMTMPGLPKQPASERIGVNQQGDITGLS
jgi:formate--tetrahydrofolate ligase